MERKLILLKVQLQRARIQDLLVVVSAALLCLFVLGLFGALGWGVVLIAAVFIALAGYLRYAGGKRGFDQQVDSAVVGAPSGLTLSDSQILIERLPDPLLLLDAEGRVLLCNSVARALLGEVTVQRHISAVVRVPAVLEAINLVLAGGEAQTVEYAVLVPVERHVRAFVTAIPVRNVEEESEDVGVIVVLHELTAQKRLEQMRVDFVANASHELRTPLASLSGFIDTLRGHAKEDEVARDRFLAIMHDQAARMSRLIDDLLSLSRIELNEHMKPEGEVVLGDVVRDVADSLGPQAKARDVIIEANCTDSALSVTGAYDELIQVVQNLAENALKYAYEGGRIIITAGHAPEATMANAAYVSVQDFGDGIPREHLPRLTERFYRVDVQNSRRAGGTGLGLAIVKHIVNRHRGFLKIDSEIDRGSTFTVYLPRYERGTQGPSVQVDKLNDIESARQKTADLLEGIASKAE